MTLPIEIGSLQGLQKLNVSHNKLSVLPIEMFKLSNLRQLNMSHNSLGEINAELNDLVMLEVLVSAKIRNVRLLYNIRFRIFLTIKLPNCVMESGFWFVCKPLLYHTIS